VPVSGGGGGAIVLRDGGAAGVSSWAFLAQGAAVGCMPADHCVRASAVLCADQLGPAGVREQLHEWKRAVKQCRSSQASCFQAGGAQTEIARRLDRTQFQPFIRHIDLCEAPTMADSPSVQPFLSSPRGVITPRTLTRSLSFSGGTPSDIIKAGLVHNRNELVLLFSRRVPCLRQSSGWV
jgi:hypothetical protein